MVNYSVIQKSQLEGAHRLDAEYYQPEYLKISRILNKYSVKSVGDVGKIAYGTTPKGGIFESKGISFIRSQNFSNLTVSASNLVFCTEEFHKQNKKSTVKPRDILFAAVGATIGEMAIVQDEIKDGNINQNIARVRIIDKNINPYFVGLFFASKLGQLQIEKLTTGNAQPYLNSEQIKSLIIPVLDIEKQDEIASYFQKIQKQIKFSKSLYSQAEQLLLEKLGIKDLDLVGELFYTISVKETRETQRFDAEYWRPKYKKLLSYLNKKFEIKRLRDLVSVKKGVEPGSEEYQEEGKPFIRVSNLSKFGINNNDQKYLTDDFYQELKRNYQPKIGEVLLSKDASPGIAYVVKESIEGIISGGILRLKVEADLEPEYLALIINSPIGQYQMERDTGGSVIVHWRPEQIRNICIPIIEKPTQQKIASLVRQSHQARKKAKELLEEAKQKVEKMILGEI